MNFLEIAQTRQSCRNYDAARQIESEKLSAVLEAARLSPSACNAQPYHITVCQNKTANAVAAAASGLGMNKFTADVPVFLVITENAYNKTAAVGAKIKKNDYRSIDIGILAAYITAEATAQGLGSCILGWFDNDKIKKLCATDATVRLVIALGYAKQEDSLRTKKRKALSELVSQC